MKADWLKCWFIKDLSNKKPTLSFILYLPEVLALAGQVSFLKTANIREKIIRYLRGENWSVGFCYAIMQINQRSALPYSAGRHEKH